MNWKNYITFFRHLKQLLLVVSLVYAFSNCQIKKTILHFTAIDSIEFSQKTQTQLPQFGSCSSGLVHKNTFVKKVISAPQIPILPRTLSFYSPVNENAVFTKVQVRPAFEFGKKSTTYPPMFIVFKNLKIALKANSITA